MKQFRWKIVTWLTTKATELSGLILKDREWPFKKEDYKAMQRKSVGYQYHQLLAKNIIEYKATLVKHDMKHIILGYDMTIRNELNIVAFLLGNQSANKVSIIYLLVCLLIVPEYTFKLKKHFQRGRLAKRLKDYDLSSFVEQDLLWTRKILNIQ